MEAISFMERETMTHYAQDHLKEIASKALKADEKLADLFVSIAKIDKERAFSLVDFYKRKKMVKLDLTNVSLNVKHGAYLDRDFIEHYATRGAF